MPLRQVDALERSCFPYVSYVTSVGSVGLCVNGVDRAG